MKAETVSNNQNQTSDTKFDVLRTEKPSENKAEDLEKPTGETLCPAERFKVKNPEYFYNFSQQLDGKSEDTKNLDVYLQQYVKDVASVIADIDGSSRRNNSPDIPFEKPDYIIYLDKSGRPVSYLVDLFYNTLAQKDENGQTPTCPPHSYLKIDRLNWLAESGAKLNGVRGEIIDKDGTLREGLPSDFHIDQIKQEDITALRALFLKHPTNLDSSSNIMDTPTVLDGKNVLIIDEVAGTGTSIEIAKQLLQKAIPDCQVGHTIFWHKTATTQVDSNGKILQNGSAPMWYYHNAQDAYDWRNQSGRGSFDADGAFWNNNFINHPNYENEVRTKAGAFLAGVYDPETEKGQVTLQNVDEMIELYQAYKEGQILFIPPHNYTKERSTQVIEDQGLVLGRPQAHTQVEPATNNFLEVRQLIASERSFPLHRRQEPRYKTEALKVIQKNNQAGALPIT